LKGCAEFDNIIVSLALKSVSIDGTCVMVNCDLQDLTAIGITQPVIRKRLTAEISKLRISDGIPNYIPVILPSVYCWCSSFLCVYGKMVNMQMCACLSMYVTVDSMLMRTAFGLMS